MKTFNLDPDYVVKCIEANRHNNATTSYYLSLKKYVSEGGQINMGNASYDLSSKSFDRGEVRRKQTGTKILIDNFFTKST